VKAVHTVSDQALRAMESVSSPGHSRHSADKLLTAGGFPPPPTRLGRASPSPMPAATVDAFVEHSANPEAAANYWVRDASGALADPFHKAPRDRWLR
jgi:hypothetical protein